MKLTVRGRADEASDVFKLLDKIYEKYEVENPKVYYDYHGDIVAVLYPQKIREQQNQVYSPSLPDEEIPF